MAGVAEYSTTAASNTTINSIGIQGNNNAQNFDNGLRQLMADIATARTDGQMASMPYVAKSSTYTVAVTDRGKFIDCTSALELDLPAAATAGAAFYFIAKANGGAVTLDPNGTEDINGSSTSATVSDGSSALVVCNGTAWFTIVIGTGNVTGPTSSTDNTVPRFNGTAGAMQTSGVSIDDSNNVSVPGSIELGHASDTTIARSEAGVATIEGKRILDGSTENQPVSGGATITPKDLGTKSSGTLTVDCGDAPWQRVVHGAGAFTLDVSAVVATCYLELVNASASGSITTSAFDIVEGDAFDNTGTNVFLCHLGYTYNGKKFLTVKAMQ